MSFVYDAIRRACMNEVVSMDGMLVCSCDNSPTLTIHNHVDLHQERTLDLSINTSCEARDVWNSNTFWKRNQQN